MTQRGATVGLPTAATGGKDVLVGNGCPSPGVPLPSLPQFPSSSLSFRAQIPMNPYTDSRASGLTPAVLRASADIDSVRFIFIYFNFNGPSQH